MFDSFRKFLSEVSEGGKHPIHFEQNDYRLAAAALLVHTAAIDGNISDRERDKLHAVIKRQFALEGRRRMVEMMWEIIYADGRVTEFESNLIWRAADLLGISSRDRIELGQRVAGRLRTEQP
jgi:uncharacterized tellurite resistance protein B-like protein